MDSSFLISSASVSDRGLSEKRPQNEDSFLEMGQCGIFAVADGVGGAQAGEVASQMAMEILGEAFTNRAAETDAEDVMREAIEKANSAIFQMAHELPQLATMATTIVALHIDGNIATIGHVGDSRLYSVDHEGNLFRETEDHSMVGDEVRAGRMTEEQAENHPSRNIINRALGAEPQVQIDLKTRLIDPGTSFLLCSDGITRHVVDHEIKGVLTFGGDPADICEYLKGLCFERGAEDNLTAVVVRTAANHAPAWTTAAAAVPPDADPLAAADHLPFADTWSDEDEEDELLELETGELPGLADFSDDITETADRDITDIKEPESDEVPVAAEAETEENVQIGGVLTEEKPVVPNDFTPQTIPFERAPTFGGGAAEESDGAERPGMLGKIAGAVGLLILGALLGAGALYFSSPAPVVNTAIPPMSEMRSANIPLSAFEENRRNVDNDPAAYIARAAASPSDCEDYYLLGRAYLLSGDYLRARAALNESRNRLADADPTNAKVLSYDIAMALAVTNDTTIQSMLKKELDAAGSAPATPAVNANR